MRVTNKPILLVEDDQVDMMRITRALKEIGVTNQIVHRENGEDALNYLWDEDSEKPCLILLDLSMPIMNGIEFLQAVKKDERLRRIPVVVLTTSDNQQDKLNGFNFGYGEARRLPAIRGGHTVNRYVLDHQLDAVIRGRNSLINTKRSTRS